MKTSITIYLADDHQIVLDGLTLLLKHDPDVIICGSATNGEQAWRELQTIKPDILITDLRMPGKDGIQLLRLVKHQLSTKCIILSMHSDRRYITDAMNYGADGFLPKNINKELLLDAIHRVKKGETCFPEMKVEREGEELFLSPRELDVLRLVMNEYSSQQIAEKLSVSQYTVDTHRKNILRKTGAKNLAGLVKYAMAHGISFEEG